MGKTQQYYKTRRPTKGLPEAVFERFNEEHIIPLYFSLIKSPRIEGGSLHNPAVGAIAIYHVITANEKTFGELCSFVCEEIKRRIKVIENLRILYANEVRILG